MFDWIDKLARRFRQAESPVGVLPEAGRSSEPTTAGGTPLRYTVNGALAMPFKPDVFAQVEELWFGNPDFAQAVLNLVSTTNTGHDLMIPTDASDRESSSAIDRLNELARRLCPLAGGVDGFLNLQLGQLCLYGALSSEAVVDFPGRRVSEIVPVPVRQIRFMWDEERQQYRPAQQAYSNRTKTSGLIPLHPETYRYLGWQFLDSSPYARPPFHAALEKITGVQATAFESIGEAIKKHRFLGFTQLSVVPPPRLPGEIEGEYQSRLKMYLASIVDRVQKKIAESGLIVAFRDQQVTHSKVDTNTTGIADLATVIEQQVMSGLGQQPVFFGRSDSSTETFAEVVYQLLLAQCQNLQRLCAARLESAYALDLALGGFKFGASVVFSDFVRRRPLEAAQADNVRWLTVSDQVAKGLISPQQAAQRMGLDEWFDEGRLNGTAATPLAPAQSRRLAYRKGENRYEFVRDAYTVRSGDVRAVRLALTEEEIDALAEGFVRRYLAAIAPVAGQARDAAISLIRSFLAGARFEDFDSAEAFAEKVFELIRESYQGTFKSSRAEREVKKIVEATYSFYRLRDTSPFGGKNPPVDLKFGGPDTRALRFFTKLDGFYFSKFVDNTSSTTKNFLADEYLKKGAALFGRGTPEDLDDFRAAVGGRLDNVADFAVETIVRTAVQRTRNWAHIRALHQGKFKLAKIVAVLDSATSDICRGLDGKFVPVGAAAETVDRLSELSPGEFASEVYETEAAREYRKDPVGFTSKFLDEDDVISEDLIRTGLGFPPYHPRCRTRLQGVFE